MPPFFFIQANNFSLILDPDNYVWHHLSARLLCLLDKLTLGRRQKWTLRHMDLRPHVLNFFSSTERFESIDKHGFYAYVDSSKI